jgi:hypothetical protein
MAVHQSRWGYHPCDYETFQKLKKLHARYWRALRGYAAWRRWQRKRPQNRVIREWLRDAQGRRIGHRIVGPRPEPPLDPLFCVRAQVFSHFAEDARLVREGTVVERVSFHDHGIPAAYRLARKPAATPEEVPAMPLSDETLGLITPHA